MNQFYVVKQQKSQGVLKLIKANPRHCTALHLLISALKRLKSLHGIGSILDQHVFLMFCYIYVFKHVHCLMKSVFIRD